MAVLITIVFVIAGAAVFGLIAFGWTTIALKGLEGDRKMWRLGAEAGPTAKGRHYAKRMIEYSARTSWLIPVVVWWFRALGAVFGAGVGYGLARSVGGLS